MEDFLGFALIAGLLYIVTFALSTGCLANDKGYNKTLWLVLGFFFSILALLVVIVLPGKSVEHQIPAGTQ